MWVESLASFAESWFGTIVLLFSLVVVAQYFLLIALAFVEVWLQRRNLRVTDRLSLFEGDLSPPISLLVPAFNEANTIVESVRSLMQLRYPAFEIIVVNDGSTDDTLGELTRAFGLRPSSRTLRARVPRERVRGAYSSPDHPFLVVLDVVNGRKAQAINIALAFSRHPLFCVLDADSVLERDTLLWLALPFYHDPSTVAVGGVVLPSNGCTIEDGRVLAARAPRSGWARFQVIEYLRAMLGGRLGWYRLDSLFLVSGALGLFSREAVMEVGGFNLSTLGEDMELTMRLQRWADRTGRRRAVRFVAGTVCWTEVPERGSSLAGQRARWHQGLAESLWLNRGLLLGERFAPHHSFTFLSFFAIELVGPLLEVAGLLVALGLLIGGRLDVPFAISYLGIFVLGGALVSLLSLFLEGIACPRLGRGRDLAVLALYALVENFGYRQLNAWWRIRGLWNAARRQRGWGAMVRRPKAAPAESDGLRRAA